MGTTSSKQEKIEALRLCKERKRFIKQAIDSRYNLAAAHVSYINSLKNIGIALRRFAEAEVLIESSLSTASVTELDNDKSPSHSSYPSPSPTHHADASDSPLDAAVSPPVMHVSYMKSAGGGGTAATVVTVKLNNVQNANRISVDGFDEDEGLGFSMPMPPPPPPFSGSWDYFDTSDHSESFMFPAQNELGFDFHDTRKWNGRVSSDDHGVIDAKGKLAQSGFLDGSITAQAPANGDNARHGVEGNVPRISGAKESYSMRPKGGEDSQPDTVRKACNGPSVEILVAKKEKATVLKGLSAEEREDPSEFITHRAKDFLSSIKEIEHRFFRASESGKEISRMLEANNIRVGYSEPKGKSSAILVLEAFNLVCCQGRTALVSNEPGEDVTKVITWKRTTSSRSSSSRNPLTNGAKDDDVSDSGSEFIEEFCMISGSHSSTLDRLYAWERKLYDEVKASECIRKEYDQKCDKLRHQFAKDHSAHVIDKTRAVAKDLHSRIRVAIHSVDSISKRIEKIRDEELHPQLLELVQGLIRMWKAMLACHHAQYITISLAYHSRSTTTTATTPQGDTRRQALSQLLQEIECFGLGFANWVNSHTSYVQALNGWLLHCIMQQPQERSKNRRPFSPRRALAPPIFVLCRDWSVGIKSLPSEELSNAIKSFLAEVDQLMHHQQTVVKNDGDGAHQETDSKVDAEKNNDDVSANLSCIHASLAKVLDRLNKFSEVSLKMYEDIRQKSEAARVAYSTCRPVRF
ncbi:unnamed protein product [Linum trigynum]|uniref:Uncharacterized protein n=1 Tax=Linum trigynum TaxID=586398 RepID=A0AAV2DT09_9ROSI